MICYQSNIDKIYLYSKDAYEAKHEYWKVRLRHFENDHETFNEYSYDMQDVYRNIEHYNIQKEN